MVFIFKGLKKINGKNYVERTIINAIKNDIAIYAIHTNLDHVATGVNKRICDRLGLTNTKIPQPKKTAGLHVDAAPLWLFSPDLAPIQDDAAAANALRRPGTGRISQKDQKRCVMPTVATVLFKSL